MRTDAKIGFAIGGVLLAVLTVYAIVVPKHKKTTPGTVTLVTPPSQNLGGAGSGPIVPPAVAENTAPVSPPITAMGTDPTPITKESVTPPVIAPVVPPLADGGKKLSNDGVFYPAGAPDDQKTVMNVDPPAPRVGSLAKTSKSHHAKEVPSSPEPIDGGTAVASADDHPYTIKAGQTLSKIASEVYGNSRFWVAIQRENKGLDANHLKVGSKIMLPDISPLKPGPIATTPEDQQPMLASVSSVDDSKTYVVKSGDNLYGICKRLYGTGRKAKDLYAMNKEKIGPDKSKLKLGMVLALPEAPTAQLVAQRPTMIQ